MEARQALGMTGLRDAIFRGEAQTPATIASSPRLGVGKKGKSETHAHTVAHFPTVHLANCLHKRTNEAFMRNASADL